MLTTEQSLTGALKQYFGFDSFRGRQEDVIKSVLEEKDTFVIMPTGGGKSLCYQLPAIISEGTALIISPLIALMKNQVDSIRSHGSQDGVAHFLNSSLNKEEVEKVKADVQSGITKMLYVAPESLTKKDNVRFFKTFKISFVAVDEAHCISEWGHDFRPEYRKIKAMINGIDERISIIALTATATPKVAIDIQKNLGMSDARVFKSSFNRPNLYYEVRPKQDGIKEVIKYIKQHQGKSGIVYCLSRKKVEELAESLQVNGINALPYHAGMEPATRANNQDAFLMEDADVIVATIAFGMGIDKPDVRFVVHHDIPKSLEGYYQETGRAGRDGGEGNCIAFYSYKDIEKLEKFMHGKPVAEQEIGRLLLLETVSYAEASMCRRKFLLHYFGEKYGEDNCKNCDNCLNPKEKIEAKNEIALMLQTILAINEKHKAKHIVNVIAGKLSNTAKQYKHNELEIFGKGDNLDVKIWESAVRQSLVAGLLLKDVENYGLIRLSKEGHAFLKEPTSFMLSRDRDYTTIDAEGGIISQQRSNSVASDQALFNLLKDLRKSLAVERGLPPFVIFQDPSLHDMAIQYPITLDEMKNIIGVGTGKALKYGKPFMELIAKYVEENEIERPQDVLVKSVVNKSGQKVYIIQSIDRKLSLEDIGKSKGLKINEVIKEIENIVDAGTKVNIDYYLDETIDEEYQDEVLEYFGEAESDDIQEALEELGEDVYTEEMIRLVRIKYMSDVAN